MATTARSSANLKPSDVLVRMYNVGFGDCFLVTFNYSNLDERKERTMLVDFGSTQRAKSGPSMRDIANLIEEHCHGHIDVVVATHRHKDHISGFGGAETETVMDALTPRRVIRPWTDDPTLARDADAPTDLDAASTRFIRQLTERDTWLRELAAVPVAATTGVRRDTSDLAEDQLPNRACIDRLDGWAEDGRGVYVKAGDALELDELPGVTLEILGPPTLLKVPGLASEAFTSSEFWAAGSGVSLLAGRLTRNRDLAAACRALARPNGYGEARWLLDRLSRNQVSLLFNVVRTFDDALNNTSIIMLVRAGSRSILLAGDAQIEDWSHTLSLIGGATTEGKQLRSILADIDLYKVGHHGSRNATPQSLFKLWEPDGGRGATRPPLVTMMSTLRGKHGKTKETAVPKEALVTALNAHTTLIRTDHLAGDAHYVEVFAHTTGSNGFATA